MTVNYNILSGTMAVHLAVQTGHLSIVKLLISKLRVAVLDVNGKVTFAVQRLRLQSLIFQSRKFSRESISLSNLHECLHQFQSV